MPDKVTKRSRNVGSPNPKTTKKKRGRPPKEKEAATPPPMDYEIADTAPLVPTTPTAPLVSLTDSNLTTTQQAPQAPQATTPAETYTGLTQVPHGLTIPTFDPNNHFAFDLATDSSKLAVTSKVDADSMVQSIEGKRQTVRVMVANIGLNTDIVKAGNDFRKLEGAVIDYATTGVNNETKYVNYQVAGVNKTIALNKLD